MKKANLLLFISFHFCLSAHAQMSIGGNTLFGNEWIDYDQTYFKILVANDGMYRIDRQTLAEAGISLDEVSARLQLFHNGQPVPMYVSDSYIEFYGTQNRGELDRFIYENGEADMLNPAYSLITDTSAYFLAVAAQDFPGPRFANTPNDLTNLPEKEAWFWQRERKIYTNSVVQRTSDEGLAQSAFDLGEGYAITRGINVDLAITFSASRRAQEAISDSLSISIVGHGGNRHQISLTANGNTLDRLASGSFMMWKKQYELGQNSGTVEIKLRDETGQMGVGYAELKYAQTFDFNNQRQYQFEIAASLSSKYLEITNFNSGNTAPILYDVTNNIRMETIVENGLVKVKLPPSAKPRTLVLLNSQNGFTNVQQLELVRFTNYADADAEFIIISNKKLYDDGAGNNRVAEYAQYRDSEAGGGYRTFVVDVEELYDQFAYGVHRHPLSIRNFVHFAKASWTDAQYILLIGKGREFNSIRARDKLAESVTFFVPTFGSPGSDNLLVASPNSQVPIIPIGRIAAANPQQIKIYLDKVREHENPPSWSDDQRAWRKRVVHLGGGGDIGEQNFIKNALEGMRVTLENNSFGAEVFSLFKTSSEPVQQSRSEALVNQINDGIGILTFYGHTDLGGFDFVLDNPSNYDNKGRYPVLFSMGCFTGNYFTNTSGSSSEQFIFEENGGAIVFVASSYEAGISPLRTFQSELYRKLGDAYYGRGVGDMMRASIQNYNNTGSFSFRSMLQQFLLHGDPSITVSPFGEPDYLLEENAVRFSPNAIDAQQDSFALTFNIMNIGKAIDTTLTIEVIRQFPDGGQDTPIEMQVSAPKYRQAVNLKIPVNGTRSIGENIIFIRLNKDDQLLEAPQPEAKQNNEFTNSFGSKGATFFVFSNTVEPISPEPYAIINEASVILQASTTNVNAPTQKYIIEIDTTALFDTPIKRAEITQIGGVISWQPSIPLQDSTVYYWRISPDSTAARGYLWKQRSFTFINDGPNGWSQSHFYQFKENQLVNIILPEASRKWKFIDNVKTIKVGNTTYTNGYLPFAEIDGSRYGYQGFSNRIVGGLYIFVLDEATGEAWGNDNRGRFESQIEWPTAAFPFNTQIQSKRAAAINFLRDTIPSGNYVLIFSLQRGTNTYEPEEWELDMDTLGTNLFEVLEAQGANLLRNTAVTGARPYVFFYKKDDPSFQTIEILADSLNQIIEEEFDIYGNWFSGNVKTAVIGNAKTWSQLQWHATPNDEFDQFGLDVYGIRSDSSAVLLMENLVTFDTTLTEINAEEFPLLRLQFNAEDIENRTTAQLDYWRVLYDGLPDAALAPNLYIQAIRDTLQQGQQARFEIAIANPSFYDMDSLLVQISIIKENGNDLRDTFRLLPLLRQDTIILRYNLDTRLLSGKQRLIVEVNPNNEQPEQYKFNNIGIFEFYVEKDRRNPLLDVTFDGMRIMDGDLVSSKPLITISLEDENQFLLLSDTSLFSVILERPNPTDVFNSIQEPIYLNAGNLSFEPATTEDKRNRATIEWQSEFTESGEYALIVQAKDVTGNTSGNVDYRVNFKVDTEAKISNMLNYPNPFSTSTRFVYTLTGAEPPADYMIRIMTVSGRIVRELTSVDLGPLRIGMNNQTEYAWDGTDAYGDRLANGVYLYQLMIKDNTVDKIGKYDTGADRFFKNNIGKLVILR